MQFLSWREVDFPGVVLAGLIAGYVMAVAGLWSARVPGLVGFDIADVGRRYMISDRPSAWFLGLLSHELNSILLTLVWASAILPNLHWSRLLLGLTWGVVLSLTLSGSLVSPMAGLGFMGKRSSIRMFATNLLLHLIWGILIALIYVPR